MVYYFFIISFVIFCLYLIFSAVRFIYQLQQDNYLNGRVKKCYENTEAFVTMTDYYLKELFLRSQQAVEKVFDQLAVIVRK